MNKQFFPCILFLLSLILTSCSPKTIQLTEQNLTVINREITAVDPAANSIALNNQRSDGMAVIEGVEFTTGTIEVELKGENVPGRSFVGIAFNIQNDSTYEAVYFRPFNFQSDEPIRRAHSVQYIFHPENGWRFLRTNFEGRYEAEFPRRPAPDDWFQVTIKINEEEVYVYDRESGEELLYVERLTDQKVDKIGLWTGFNSKGAFRNLRITK